MIRKYVKKPVVIEAVRFNDWDNIDDIIDFCGIDNILITENNEVYLKTLEGNMRVNNGDYVIKGIKGEFYPCKPDIFEVTYR